MAEALVELTDGREGLDFLRQAAYDEYLAVRAALALRTHGANDGFTLDVLRSALRSLEGSWIERRAVVEALVDLGAGDEATIDALRRTLFTQDSFERDAVVKALVQLNANDEATLTLLHGRLSDPHTEEELKETAIEMLGMLGARDERTLSLLRNVLSRRAAPLYLRFDAARALGEIGANDAATLEILRDATADPTGDPPCEGANPEHIAGLRGAAAEALGRIGVGDEATLRALRELLFDESAYITSRCQAADALGELAEQ